MAAVQLGWSGHYIVWTDSTNTLTVVDRPELSDAQVKDIVAFLQALSSPRLVAQDSVAVVAPEDL